jgi:hypothetical protein
MTCPNCNSTFDTHVDHCSKCGYPFSGTEKEKSLFIAQQIIKVGHIDDAKESLKTAKTTLFSIGVVNIILTFFSTTSPIVLAFSIIIGSVFIVFGFIVEKKPFLFLVIPFTLLMVFYIGDALIDPMTLVKGLLWKVMYFTALVYAIVRVKRAEKIKKESQYLGQQ